MLGGMFRHFRSLRQLERDHGFIFTLLEEAENERMHLIVCMSFFEAGPFTRFIVQAGQVGLTPFLAGLYLIRPQCALSPRRFESRTPSRSLATAMLSFAAHILPSPQPHTLTAGGPMRVCFIRLLHRFVGYLEETAVHTYTNIVQMTNSPGTKLHTAWKDTPAPQAAIDYWQLPADAMWVDCLKRMLADESHHRDVNHAVRDLEFERIPWPEPVSSVKRRAANDHVVFSVCRPWQMASMSADEMFGEANPFIHEHKADYEAGVRRYTEAVLKRALADLDLQRTHTPDVLATKK